MTTPELLDKRIRDIQNELVYIDTYISKKADLLKELDDLQASKAEHSELIAIKLWATQIQEEPI